MLIKRRLWKDGTASEVDSFCGRAVLTTTFYSRKIDTRSRDEPKERAWSFHVQQQQHHFRNKNIFSPETSPSSPQSHLPSSKIAIVFAGESNPPSALSLSTSQFKPPSPPETHQSRSTNVSYPHTTPSNPYRPYPSSARTPHPTESPARARGPASRDPNSHARRCGSG